MPKEQIKYLDYFDTVEYGFSDGEFNSIVDITKSVIIEDRFNLIQYLKYNIINGERPDQVSLKLYNDSRYYWLLFIFNDHLREGLKNWPLSYAQFDEMVQTEYDPYCFISPEPVDETRLNNYHFTLLPFNENYYDDIEVWVKDFEDNYVKTDLTIHKYDANRFGIILKKGQSNYFNELGISNKIINNAFDPNARKTIYFKAKDTVNGANWLEAVKRSNYPTIETGDSPNVILVPMYYNVAFSHEYLKNAVYNYYKIVGDENILENHYDVIYDSIINENGKKPQEITFIEYETILNNRKAEIVVPKKEYVREILNEFKNLISI